MPSSRVYSTVYAPFLLLVATLMPGCASVQETYGQYQDKIELTYVGKAKIACSRFGFTENTDAFAQCVNTNVNAEKDRDTREREAFHSEVKKK
ncbi:MAG: hypothetical protein V4723_07235 [Pseudomonadota bacterium]